MIYAALAALLLAQASGEPVFHASANLHTVGGLAGQDVSVMHRGRHLLTRIVGMINCGGLGNEVCADGGCKEDFVPVNMGGASTICRKPEEAPGDGPDNGTSGGEGGSTDAHCGSLGSEVCADGGCKEDFVPVNMGGLSTICRKPEEAPQGGQPEPTPEPEPEPEPTPEPTTPPPNGDFEFSGELTYYGGAGAGGACTQTWVPPGFNTFALNAPQYEAANECGTCVYACWVNEEVGTEERCVEAIIDNKCPECAFGDLDLGEGGSGRWPVRWNKVPCPSSGGLQFSKQGSNASYAKVKAEGGPVSVTGMTCNGIQGIGTPDGYFEFNDTGNQNLDQGMECEVTFSDGSSQSASGV